MNESASHGGPHSIYGEELPDDPADLFVVLYDLLSDEHFRARKPIAWRKSPTVQGLANDICRDTLKSGHATPELASHIVRQHGDRGLFAVLTGLDWALGYVNPFIPSYDVPTMGRLARRYARHHRLNSPATRTRPGSCCPAAHDRESWQPTRRTNRISSTCTGSPLTTVAASSTAG